MTDIQSSLILYQTPDGQTRVEVKLEDETVWLTQAQMAELFDKSQSTINEHIQNIYSEWELILDNTMRKFGNSENSFLKPTNYYNLDVIISVGYRVHSHRGTQFRIWATDRLREYIIKGFTLDDDRLKEMGYKNDYFQELIERIRDIRTSEANFYYKVKEIYKLSADYEEDHEITQQFFKQIQNKFHWAVHHHTASELVYERADAKKPNMGLMTYANQKKGGKVRKTDVTIAKNYLNEDELKKLNLLVEQFLAFAETQAMSGKEMYMRDWIKKLWDILTMNDMEILANAGRISHARAEKKAEQEYEKYKERCAIESGKALKELDVSVKTILKQKKKK
jgi:hypothetical protein